MATGADVVTLAKKHLRESYVLGARAPMANSKWKGPWDCAEFTSWCLFQASGILFGTKPTDDPVRADAYTGFWVDQAVATRAVIPVDEAAAIAGAFVVRRPVPARIGHIVISDGLGGTVEAHSKNTGVIASTLSGRRWDIGVLVPGLTYYRGTNPVVVAPPPADILRLTNPLTRGPIVEKIQKALAKQGFATGRADGVYGPQTASAVIGFQAANGLVADGEVGPATRKKLGL